MPAVFKHMKPEEKALWEQFLNMVGADPKDYIYDVRVGAGAPIPDGTADAMKRQIEALTQHRIDAIGLIAVSTHLFEVKKDFGLSAIGQVLGYINLLKKDIANGRYTFPADIIGTIVYETAEADVVAVANDLGILTVKIAA